MFGKKKKQAQLEAEQAKAEALKLEEEKEESSELPLEQEEQPQEEKIFFESELIDDEEDNDALPKEYEAIAYILKQETGEDLVALPVDDEPSEEIEEAPLTLEEVEEEAPLELVEEESEQAPVEDALELVDDEEVETEEKTPTPTAPVAQPDKEEVVYVVDGPEDDDELVKPAKLVKLPNLVDYMLAQNMSKQMKINIATLLLSAYNKYKDIPEEKKIIIQCMIKVMRSLIQG